jgi:hypothetical protein
VLNHDKVTGIDIENNEKVYDALEVEEDLFCEEELMTVLRGLKNNLLLGVRLVSLALEKFSLEKAYDALEVEEDLFCEEELKTVLKGLKNNR